MYPHLIHLHGPWDLVAMDGERIATIPMPATLPLPSGGELRRSFQWVSPARIGERIFLVIERLVGSPQVLLNGEELAGTRRPWQPIRWEITNRLKNRNQIALRFPESTPQGGVLESIHLVIESEFAQNVQIEWDWNEPTDHPSFRARMTLESSDLSGPERTADLRIELNKQPILRLPIVIAEGVNRFDFEHGPVDLDPWRPSTVGLPIRQDVRIILQSAGDILWQRSMQVGFRRVQSQGRDDGSVVIAGEHDFPRNDEFSSTSDLWRSDGLDGIGEARGRIDLVGELAGHHVYDWADRRGLLVCHDPRGDSDLEQAIKRRSEHPCVVLLPNRPR